MVVKFASVGLGEDAHHFTARHVAGGESTVGGVGLDATLGSVLADERGGLLEGRVLLVGGEVDVHSGRSVKR